MPGASLNAGRLHSTPAQPTSSLRSTHARGVEAKVGDSALVTA
jgi:hypothetical protein